MLWKVHVIIGLLALQSYRCSHSKRPPRRDIEESKAAVKVNPIIGLITVRGTPRPDTSTATLVIGIVRSGRVGYQDQIRSGTATRSHQRQRLRNRQPPNQTRLHTAGSTYYANGTLAKHRNSPPPWPTLLQHQIRSSTTTLRAEAMRACHPTLRPYSTPQRHTSNRSSHTPAARLSSTSTKPLQGSLCLNLGVCYPPTLLV